MAICDCGAVTSRLKIKCTAEDGSPLPQPWKSVCRQCAPDEFGRWQDPSNKHGGFRYQYEPQKYIKREDKDGAVTYEATDERNADLEADLKRDPLHDAALAKRRAGPKHSLSRAEKANLEARARAMVAQRELMRKWMN